MWAKRKNRDRLTGLMLGGLARDGAIVKILPLFSEMLLHFGAVGWLSSHTNGLSEWCLQFSLCYGRVV